MVPCFPLLGLTPSGLFMGLKSHFNLHFRVNSLVPLLKPDISSTYQSVCSKSNPVTTFLFGDKLPKHIKNIGEVNKISRKTLARANTIKCYIPEYKSNYNQQFGQCGRRGPFLGSRGYSRQQYQNRKGNHAATSVKTFKVQTDKA